jgi:glycosyltransferase involved in cell wall biosynthesis
MTLGRPSIAVYAIMKNEQAHVSAWASSVLPEADFVVVLDTGSEDDTVECLVDLDVEVHCGSIRPFRFDTAFNAALALVPDSIDVVMRLDADETVEPGWVNAIAEVYDDGISRYVQHCVNHGHGWGEMWRPYIHARHGMRWKYPTHELLVGPYQSVEVPGARVHHWPDESKWRGFNLEVLTEAVADDPHDTRMMYYLGREQWYANDWVSARQTLMRFLDMPGGYVMERAEAWRIIAAMDVDPERWLWKAVGEVPGRREAWVDLTRLAVSRGDWGIAEAMYGMAARCTDQTLYVTQADCLGGPFEALWSTILARGAA